MLRIRLTDPEDSDVYVVDPTMYPIWLQKEDKSRTVLTDSLVGDKSRVRGLIVRESPEEIIRLLEEAELQAGLRQRN